jgi:hypothetical protein
VGGAQNQDQESESLVENGNLRVESSELIYEELIHFSVFCRGDREERSNILFCFVICFFNGG